MARIRPEGKMTIEEHLAFGEAIARIRHSIFHASQCFKVKSKGTKHLGKALKAIEDMRCEMDNVICHDYPDYEAATEAYYNVEVRVNRKDCGEK